MIFFFLKKKEKMSYDTQIDIDNEWANEGEYKQKHDRKNLLEKLQQKDVSDFTDEFVEKYLHYSSNREYPKDYKFASVRWLIEFIKQNENVTKTFTFLYEKGDYSACQWVWLNVWGNKGNQNEIIMAQKILHERGIDKNNYLFDSDERYKTFLV